MRSQSAKLPCPGCGCVTDVYFAKAQFLSPRTVFYECSGCESNLTVQIKRAKSVKVGGPNKGKLDVKFVAVVASETLRQILKEEAESKKDLGDTGKQECERESASTPSTLPTGA